MRFRITINPRTADWEVQICRFAGLWWQALPQVFTSYYAAEEWILQQGLPEAYAYQPNLDMIHQHEPRRSTGQWPSEYEQRMIEARDKANRASKKAKVVVQADPA